MATVKITNILTTVIDDTVGKDAVISPTGITQPGSPVQEYISDMVTLTDGTLTVPAYNKVQSLYIPFGGYITFTITDYKEINYYVNLRVDGATVEVYDLLTAQPADWSTNYTNYFTKSDDTYTPVTGGSAPTFEADTYYKKVTA